MPASASSASSFDEGEVFLPELMLAAEAMEAAMAICNAALPEGQSESRGTVVIGTVKGDVHDIGKAIVVSYLRASGYAVLDLGRDVEAETFVEQAIEVKADIVGSARCSPPLCASSVTSRRPCGGRGARQGEDRRRRRGVYAGLGERDRRRCVR